MFLQLISHTLYKRVNVPTLQFVFRGVVCFSPVINGVLCVQNKAKRFDS